MQLMGKALLELVRIQTAINKWGSIPREDMISIGFLAADRIKVRTRLGNDRNRSSLKPLSSGYKLYRQRYPFLYDKTTPSKSNLTLTGQLLNSMDVKSDKPNAFTVFFKENRTPRWTYDGRPTKGDNATNSDIVSHQLKQGRDFFGFSDAELSFISSLMRQYFKESFKL
jgi:hypothetical protein